MRLTILVGLEIVVLGLEAELNLRILVLLALVTLLLAGCNDQPSATAVPASPTLGPSPQARPPIATAPLVPSPTLTPSVTATATPTPTVTRTPPTSTVVPTPTFSPGAVILPTVEIPTRTPSPADADPLEEILSSISSHTSSLRNLFSLGPIARKIITRDELSRRLLDDLEDDREEIYETQELYITLGIMAEDTDFFDLLLNLYSEGVAGFFDTDEEELFVVQDADEFGPQDALTLAHEFTHGLQQQHFDIHSLLVEQKENSDRSLALRALVEGDASITERIYLFQFLDEDERTAAQEAVSSVPLEVFEAAPHVVRRIFTFPYQEGFRFAARLLLATNSWELIDRAYEQLPESSEQILHLDKYQSSETPDAVELPDISADLGEGWTELSRDTLGEFRLMIYLETELADERPAVAAEGWGGDSFSLLKGPQDQNVLVSLISWDSESDAQEFFDTFLDFIRVRTELEWESVETDEMIQVIALPAQDIYIKLEVAETLLIFAPDSGVLEAARAAIESP